MATGQQAIERISEVSGITYHSVFRAARALREAKEDLWPASRPGRVKEQAQVQVHHLSNLAIALATPDPHTAREQAVKQIRDFEFSTNRLLDSPERPPVDDLSPFEKCATFGEALNYWIEHPDDFPAEAKGLCSYGPVQALLLSGDVVAATICREWRASDALPFEKRPRGALYWYPPKPRPREIAGAIHFAGTIPFSFIKVLAELLADSRARQAALPPSPSGSASTTAASGNENAALPQAAPRRPRKRVAAADGLSRPAATLTHHGRERQHVVLGHSQMGLLPLGV